MKIYLDTNVLASALATRGLCVDLFEAVLQSHELLISEAVVRELERVLPGKRGQSDAVTAGFVSLLRAQAILVAQEHPAPSLPDSDDEAIVAAAIAGGADVFVTSDKVLLELQSVEQLPIVSPRRLYEILASQE